MGDSLIMERFRKRGKDMAKEKTFNSNNITLDDRQTVLEAIYGMRHSTSFSENGGTLKNLQLERKRRRLAAIPVATDVTNVVTEESLGLSDGTPVQAVGVVGIVTLSSTIVCIGCVLKRKFCQVKKSF